MPRIEFTDLPAAARATSPFEVLENQFKETQDFFANEEQTLKRTPMSTEDFNNSIRSLQSDYDNKKMVYTALRQQFDTIQKLTREGQLDPDKGNEAMWRLILPTSTQKVMFPEAETEGAGPFSPTQLKAYDETMEEFAQSAPSTPAFWTSKTKQKRPQAGILEQYKEFQEYSGYGQMSPTRRRQLDMRWDAFMAANQQYEWNPESPEIRALRTTGKLTSVVAKQVTPLAQGIMSAAKPKPKKTVRIMSPMGVGWQDVEVKGKKLTTETAREFFREANGNKEKARKMAVVAGYEL